MPVIIEEDETCCYAEGEVVIGPVEYNTIPILLASFQFGLSPIGDLFEVCVSTVHMEYAEFMQTMYSWSGEFIFCPKQESFIDLLRMFDLIN